MKAVISFESVPISGGYVIINKIELDDGKIIIPLTLVSPKEDDIQPNKYTDEESYIYVKHGRHCLLGAIVNTNDSSPTTEKGED